MSPRWRAGLPQGLLDIWLVLPTAMVNATGNTLSWSEQDEGRHGSMTKRDQALTALDWVAIVIAVGGALTLAQAGFTSAPAFGEMYAEFDSSQSLPALTKFALKPWAALLIATPAIVMLASAWYADALPRRRVFIVGAFIAAVIGWGVFLWAMYLPIFDVAGAVNE